MAKYCTNCGHELREDDKFCAGCGMKASRDTPSMKVSGDTVSQSSFDKWESCQIIDATGHNETVKTTPPYSRTISEHEDGRLYARAIHPKRGHYVAGEVEYNCDYPILNPKTNVTKQQALDILLARLKADGWIIRSFNPGAPYWWEFKFDRPVH